MSTSYFYTCFQKNEQVKQERSVFDVIEIVLQLDQFILICHTIAVLHLGPTCEARFDAQAIAIKDIALF